MIDVIKVLITLAIFLKASVHDIKEREVPDELWIFMVVCGLILDGIQYFIQPYSLLIAILQFVIIFALANFMFYVAGFGGADAKALIALSVMFPVYPRMGMFPILNTGIGIFAFSVLSNSVIVAPILALMLFIRNLKERDGKLIYKFIGLKVDADRIPRFYNLLEYVDEDWKVVRVVRGVEPSNSMLKRLKEAKEKRIIDRVWVTPALPFLVFMTAGFVIAVVFGDILVWLMCLILA